MQPQLNIETFGRLNIRLDGKLLNGVLSAKGRGMAVYLAANRHTHSRDTLELYFMEEFQPTTSFRRELSELKHALPGCLEITHTTVKLRTEISCQFDGNLLERHIPELCRIPVEKLTPARVKQLEDILLLYKGDFLASLYINTVEFQTWAALLDINYRSLVTTGWDKVVEYYLATGDCQRGVLQCMRLLKVDDLRSESYRKLMLLLAKLGQRRTALEVYEKARERLKNELDVDPTPETVELYQQIRQGKFRTGQDVNS